MTNQLPPFANNTGSDISAINRYHQQIADDIVGKVSPYWDFKELDGMLNENIKKLLPLRVWPHAGFEFSQIRGVLTHSLFQTWVLIAIYYENKHVKELLGLKEGFSAAFAAQHLSPQLMYAIASFTVGRMTGMGVIAHLREKDIDLFYPIDGIDATDEDKALFLEHMFDGKIMVNSIDPALRQLLWQWCVQILELKNSTWTMFLIDYFVKHELTNLKSISNFFATGEYLETGTMLDMYIKGIVESYLSSYHTPTGQTYAQSLNNLDSGNLSIDFVGVFQEQRAIYQDICKQMQE